MNYFLEKYLIKITELSSVDIFKVFGTCNQVAFKRGTFNLCSH